MSENGGVEAEYLTYNDFRTDVSDEDSFLKSWAESLLSTALANEGKLTININ